MAFGLFRMMFSAGGNAVPVLEQMTAASNKLVTASGSVSGSLQIQAGIMLRNSSAGDKLNASFITLITRMQHLATTGQVSSSSLISLAKQMEVLGGVTPRTAARIQNFRNQLLTLSAGLRETEQAAAKAGSPTGGFQMMTDVSAQTATKMRMVSSASQGAMIAMSLLQRNVTGLAFSLIFLQFSGFLKLSLAVGGALALVGGMALGFRALIQEGMKMRKLNDQFFILTGSTEASALAMHAARTLADKYGIAIGPLLQAQMMSLTGKLELTNEQFDTFAGLLALADAGIIHNIEDSEALAKKFFSLRDSGKTMDEILKELGLTTKTFTERLENLDKTDLGQQQRSLAGLRNALREAFADPSADVSGWWQKLKESFMLSLTGFFQITQNEIKVGIDNLGAGVWGLVGSVINPIGFAIGNLLKFMFIDPWIGIAKDTKAALGSMFKDIDKLFMNWSGWQGIKDQFKSWWKSIGDTFSGAFKALTKEWKSGWRDLEFSWLVFQMRIKRKISDFISSGWKNMFKTMATVALDALTLGMFGVGVEIVRNIWAGIRSIPIVKWIYNWAWSVINSIKRAFNIKSPSKEMFGIGENIIAGFQQGITGTTSGRRASGNVNININVRGAFSNDPRAASQSVATQVLKGITRQGAFSGAPLVA